MKTDLAKHLYRTMIRIRRFEEMVSKWFYEGKIPGFVHLYIGEEAIAAGVCAALRKEDTITSTHRGHGHVLAKGADTKRMMAEIFGRATGLCKGKGGSMHLTDMGIGVLGANGILAGGTSLATGAALSAVMQGNERVAVTFVGDAAASQGVVWESLNLASVWKLPVIFVIENNGFGEWTPTRELTSTDNFACRAPGFGAAGIQVDGNDVVAVYAAAEEAVQRARRGEGPTVIDCLTYRWMGHSEGEDAFIGRWSYRTQEELEKWKKRDPIVLFKQYVLEQGLLSQAELDAINDGAYAEMEEAVAYSQASPMPELESALVGVFKR